MANHYLRKLRQKSHYSGHDMYYGESADGSDPLYNGHDFYGNEPTVIDLSGGKYGAAKMVGVGLLAMFGLILAPTIYEKLTGKSSAKMPLLGDAKLRQLGGGSNVHPQINTIPSFNMQHQMRPLEKAVVDLLQNSKNAYDSQGSVNEIVEPFAMAQEMIHSPQFKSSYQQDPVKMQIVEDFATLGTELGG